MNPETDIICLEIVKGILKAPGDTESAEQELVTLDLLDPNGFSVQTDGWTPAFPGIKRGGTWAESQITDGRALVAAARENVTETIRLAIGNIDLKQRFQLLGKLNRMIDDARAFWKGDFQPQPVYLKFKASCASVYQYALIFDGSIAEDNDPFEESNPWNVTLILEREIAWRMIVPPGSNPLEYHFWSQGKTRGIEYDWEDLIMYGNEDHFEYAVLNNACEFNGADKTTFLTRDWIDVDGSKIPGDAPALLCTTWTVAQKSINQLYMARGTEPRRRYSRKIDEYAYFRNTLCAGDATIVTRVADGCGLRSNNDAVNRYIHQATILAATTTFTDTLEWRLATGQPSSPFLINQMYGEWAMYLRCQATNGADGDLEARIVLNSTNALVATTYYPSADVPYRIPGASCTTEFDLLYMGRVTFPLQGQIVGDKFGLGYDTYQDNWDIAVQVRNTAGANRTFEALDLVFLPIHEGNCIANPDANSTTPLVSDSGNPPGIIAIDNTGYFSHGKNEDICVFITTSNTAIAPLQLLGNALTLKPGVDNRIYILFRNYSSNGRYSNGAQTPTGGEFQARLNIVPRCYGIADL